MLVAAVIFKHLMQRLHEVSHAATEGEHSSLVLCMSKVASKNNTYLILSSVITFVNTVGILFCDTGFCLASSILYNYIYAMDIPSMVYITGSKYTTLGSQLDLSLIHRHSICNDMHEYGPRVWSFR